LGYSTSARGPCHTHAFSHIFEKATIFPELGINKVMDRFQSEGKADMVIKAQNVMNLWENLSLCKYTFFGGVQLRHISEWLKDVLGWTLSGENLVEVGERSFHLKRMLNVRWGISRKDDTLPPRILTHRVNDGAAGNHLPPFNVMLADYYEKRGWSKEGIPTEEIFKNFKSKDGLLRNESMNVKIEFIGFSMIDDIFPAGCHPYNFKGKNLWELLEDLIERHGHQMKESLIDQRTQSFDPVLQIRVNQNYIHKDDFKHHIIEEGDCITFLKLLAGG
jgi:sulfur carrier protein ThiS